MNSSESILNEAPLILCRKEMSNITVRELIQMLVLNCDLDDTVNIETKREKDNDVFTYEHYEPRHVYHCQEEALIECHDD